MYVVVVRAQTNILPFAKYLYLEIFEYNFIFVSKLTPLSHQCVQHVRSGFTMLDHTQVS